MKMPGFLSNSLAMNPNPSQARSALVQRLLAQSMTQEPQSGSVIESLNIASKPLLASLLAQHEDRARGTREQGLAGALSRTSSIDPYKAEAAKRASSIIAGGMPDNPLAQVLLGQQAQQAFAPVGGEEPYTLGQGEVRYGANNQPVASNPKPVVDEQNIPALVNDISDDLYKESQPFTIQLANIGNIRQSIGDASPAGDMGLVYGYMKMLDPTSAVREAEYATAENARGVPASVRNIWNRLQNGQRLDEDQRQDFSQRAERYFAQERANQSRRNDRFLARATASGIPADAFRQYLLPLDPAPTGAPTAPQTQGPASTGPAPSGPPRRRIP